jgi:hypothetical protein
MAKGFCDLSNVVNTSTRDILENQNTNTRAILDFLTQDKIATLTAENQSLKFQASQTAQNAFITAIQQGICDSTYALNNTITGGFNAVTGQLADCCCQTQRAIDGVNFNMAKGFCDLGNVVNNGTRDILENQNTNTRAILDFLTQDKIATLTAENQTLKFKASQTEQNAFITANQQAQTAELIRRLGADCPTPAYVVQPPTPVNFPVNACGQAYGFGGCGCN